jgi:hypothetical protein
MKTKPFDNTHNAQMPHELQAAADRFAAAALAGTIASYPDELPTQEDAARQAWDYAAAMMRERAIRGESGAYMQAATDGPPWD